MPSLLKLSSVALVLILAGCGAPNDKIYSLKLDFAPTDTQWAQSVPYRLRADGGVTSQASDGAVDEDSVHTATASCHHGAGSPPVDVEIKSFYTGDILYLRFEWGDPTRDEGPVWRWAQGGWTAGGAREDGLGILWGSEKSKFECTHLCHMVDWRMAGAKKSSAEFSMVAPEGSAADFWIWRSGRARPGGMAEDATLTPKGKAADGLSKDPLFIPNSNRAKKGLPEAFYPGDLPIAFPIPEPRASAMGYILAEDAPGRTEVDARGEYSSGRWVLTLARPLKTSSPEDVTFAPGGEYQFGLAILDGVALDHNATRKPLHLTLVTQSPESGTGTK